MVNIKNTLMSDSTDAWSINNCNKQRNFIFNISTGAFYAWISSVLTILLLLITIATYITTKEINKNIIILLTITIICCLISFINQQQVDLNIEKIKICEKISES